MMFNSNKTKVIMSPSSVFLAKNQLGSEGPESVQQATILDSNMPEDRALCPVRALRLYLDRTKQCSSGKHLLFLSLRPNFARDVARSTISHWIMHTIKFCFEGADEETE